MNTFSNLYTSLLIIAFSLLIGCATITEAPAKLDKQAKTFKSNPNYSQVYLYRNETLGSSLSIPVNVNCKYAGTTGPNSYFKFDLPEGKHTFITHDGESILTIDTLPGEIYFIWQKIEWGLFSGGSSLHLVSDSEGRNGVLESTLIDSNQSFKGQPRF